MEELLKPKEKPDTPKFENRPDRKVPPAFICLCVLHTLFQTDYS